MDTLQKIIERYDLSQKLQDDEFRGATYILNLLIEDGALDDDDQVDEFTIAAQVAEIYKEIHSDKDLGEFYFYDIDTMLHLYYNSIYKTDHVKLDKTVLDLEPNLLRDYLLHIKKKDELERLMNRRQVLKSSIERAERFKIELQEIDAELRKLDE